MYLHNGDPLGKQLVFSENDKFLSNNFDDAAEDAIRREQYVVNTYNLSPESKDIVALLCFAEKYNGTGYYDNGRISPYIYSGTNVYASGKYVKDHIYDPNVIDGQVGVYLILNALLNEDGSSEENY